VDKKAIRNVFYYKRYYLDFFESLRPEVKAKFNWTLGLIETLDRVPSKFFSYMENTDGIYEIRVEVGSDIFRVFSFFDKGQLIINHRRHRRKRLKWLKN
jgi:hypothetical protein